jgi:hypothetical protein
VINKLLEEGVIKYAHIFVVLLRLRQCASHPFLLESTIKDSWTPEDVQRLKDGLAKLSDDHTPFYDQCAAWVKQSEEERRALKEAKKRGDAIPERVEIMPFGSSDFGHCFAMGNALDSIGEEEVVCGICGYVPHDPRKTSVSVQLYILLHELTVLDLQCGHIFCRECLDGTMHKDVAADEFDFFVCHICDKIFTEVTPYKGFQVEEEADGNVDSSTSFEDSKSKAKKRDGPGTDVLGFEPKSPPSTWLTMSDRNPDIKLVPSTKVTLLKSILLKSFDEAPMDKV